MNSHITRRALLKRTLLGASGAVVANFGGLFNSSSIADEVRRSGKRCILLWANGGASQIDTFDMKPGQATGGAFRPINTNVTGLQICEYLPKMARLADKLAVIRSMQTSEPDHPGGIHLMHTGYRQTVSIAHPELGAMVAKYCGNPDADLPNFIRMGSTGNAGSGYLGPQYQPFGIDRDGRLGYFMGPATLSEADRRRNEMLRFVEEGFARDNRAEPYESHRRAQDSVWRLQNRRAVFDISQEWMRAKERYGDTSYGRSCFMALRLIESGVSFVECGQENYDSHADNFVCHKANLNILDPAWSALLTDLSDRGHLANTLVIWMGEVGRTPQINNRVGRDHFVRGWTVVLAGGGARGGVVYGATNPNGNGVRDNPVTESDLFATIYTALGINPRVRHVVGTRPIWATPEGSRILREVLV